MIVEYIKHNTGALSPTYFRSGKTLNITYFECVCRLKIFRMQCSCAILSSMTCLAVLTFSTLSHKQHEFRENVIERKMCVLIFYTKLSKKVYHFKNNWARCDQICVLGFMVNCPLFLSGFDET